MNGNGDGKWRLDKHIPIALVVTIALQTTALISWTSWWASALETRVTALEANTQDAQQVRTDIAVTKSQIDDIRSLLTDIKDEVKEQNKKLEKLTNGGNGQ